MKQKEVVIVVPGAYDLSHYPSWLKNFCISLLKLIRIKPTLRDHKQVWKSKIRTKDVLIWMRWTRQIDPFSIWLAKRRLRRLIHHYKNEKVCLVGVSLGSKIILDEIKRKFEENINKIILVCGVDDHKNINFSHPKIINIFSRSDNFVQMAIYFYSPLSGGQKLIGKNIRNVLIPKMTHDEFCSDMKIRGGRFKGKTITQLVNYFLKN